MALAEGLRARLGVRPADPDRDPGARVDGPPPAATPRRRLDDAAACAGRSFPVPTVVRRGRFQKGWPPGLTCKQPAGPVFRL